MRLKFLGTGGNSPIPMPTCSCSICEEAREKGGPYARRGNSMFLRDINALIDAPEYTFTNLNEESIEELDYIFLTHWHPDHVNGLRVIQSRDFSGVDRTQGGLLDGVEELDRPTIVTTSDVYEKICEVFGQIEHFVDEVGFADVHFLDEEPLVVDGIEVRSIPYALTGGEEDATAFVFEEDDVNLVVAIDDAKYLDETKLPDDIDVAVFECGLFERDTDGNRILDGADMDFIQHEPRHDEIIERVRRLEPDRTYLTEIGHINERSFDDYEEIQREYDSIYFAYDGLEVEILNLD